MKEVLEKKTPYSIGKQELINFIISAILPLILLLLLTFGVSEDGSFKNSFVTWAVDFIATDFWMWVALLSFLPLLYLLLKVALCDLPKYKWFNTVAQLLTGTFYSFGLVIVVTFSVTPKYGYEFRPDLLLFGLATILLGYGSYVILQAAIQRTFTPKT